jgi:zinc protease
MLDRSTPPVSHPLRIPILSKPEISQLQNGIEIASYLSKDQSLVSIDFIFPFSNLHFLERQKENYAFRMLLEGTKQKTSKQIADAISFLGATVEISHQADYETISVSCLSRVLPSLINILKEIWAESTFPAKEWKTIKETIIQQNAVNQQKTGFLAGRLLRKKLYGSELDYGYSLDPELLLSFSPEKLKNKFHSLQETGPALVVVSGWIEKDASKQLEDWLSGFKNIGNLAAKDGFSVSDAEHGVHWDEKDDSQQTSLRIGKWSINSLHPDSSLFNVVLEIYGGYFGSRLMGNIREDKGWTYGISAQRAPNVAKPYWQIGSDVKGEVALLAVSEIKKEAEILINELVSEEELDLVKNYMIGQFISSITNCYGLADRYRSMWINGQSFERVQKNLITIQEATVEQVQEIAQKYLQMDDAVIALSGKKPS